MYLHQVIKEALRKYPPLPFLERMCTNPSGYSLIPDIDFEIPFGMPIHIPVHAMYRDDKVLAKIRQQYSLC
jgi:cytochrome P450 family 6